MEDWVVPSGVKKWLFTFSLVVFLFLSFALTTTASTGMMGDVNGDGVIDVRDSVMVLRHALGLQSLSTSQRLLADVNGDGLINVVDVNLITQRTLGLMSHFPVLDLYTVSFIGNGGLPVQQSRTARHGDTMLSTFGSMPTNPTRGGFNFSGWNTRVDGLGTWFAIHTPIYSNINLYAQWQPITQEHTISFNANGGTPNLQTRIVMHDASLGTMPGAMPTPPMRTAHIFPGWNTRSDGMGSWFTSSTVVYASSTVYAQWQPLNTTHIISFNGNGGSPALQTRTVSYGSSLGIMPSNPILLGVQFVGWNTAPDGSGTTFTAWTPVYGDLIVYAQWQVVSLSHTVTFDGNGGTPAIQTRTVSHGESLSITPGAMPLPPSRTGSTFIEWNTHWTGYGNSFTPWTAVVEDLIVYAVWSF